VVLPTPPFWLVTHQIRIAVSPDLGHAPPPASLLR
jgi:hypothetical protein